MNYTILKDIIRDGCIIPFNTFLDRIPLNTFEYGRRALEEFPEYILVMVPSNNDKRHQCIIDCTLSTDGFEYGILAPGFTDEWIPRIRMAREVDAPRLCEPVGTVTIYGGKHIPYVGSAAKIIFMANGSKNIIDHIYQLVEINSNCKDGTIGLTYNALSTTGDADHRAIEPIRRYLRELIEDNDTTDCASLYPKFTTTLTPPRHNFAFDYKWPARINLDLKRAFPPIECVPRGKYITNDDLQYCETDLLATLESFKYYMTFKENNMVPGIKKVIFNKPCTIVLWEDGTKTMVRTQGKARFDKEKGLAMCIAKKALGNKGNYYDEFRKWVE